MKSTGLIAAVAVCTVGFAALASVATRTGAADLEQATALQQLLAAHRAVTPRTLVEAASLGSADERQLAKARVAMRALEGSLQGELSGVEKVLAQLESPGVRTKLHTEEHAASVDDDEAKWSKRKEHAASVDDDEAKWSKRTMQRGALRHESTQKQLTRVLKKELSDKIHSKLKWSKRGLDAAEAFADYLRRHPLPVSKITRRAKAAERQNPPARLQVKTGTDGGDISAEKEDDGVVKVTFKREMTMTDKQYREMEDALQNAYVKGSSDESDASEGDTAGDEDSDVSSSTARLHKYVDRAKAEQRREGTPSEPGEAEMEKAAATPQPVRTHPVVKAASQGEEVKNLLERILGMHAQKRKAARHSGRKLPTLASSALLETHHDKIPLAVAPYYWGTVPESKRARMQVSDDGQPLQLVMH